MPTLRQSFCAAEHCSDDVFVRRMLQRSLHRRARLLSPLLSWLQPEYFALDRELIEQVGRAGSMTEVDNEIRDFMMDSRNYRWSRMRMRIRVSTTRLRRLARHHLRSSKGDPAVPNPPPDSAA